MCNFIITQQLGMRVTADGARHRSDSATPIVSSGKYVCNNGHVVTRVLSYSVNLWPPQLGWGLTSRGSLATAKTLSA